MADRHGSGEPRPAPTIPPVEASEVVTSIVHDLRAPLAAATGYVQFLQERGDALDTAGRARALADALDELRRTADLVEGLLQVAAERVPDPELVDLADVADAAVRTGRGLVRVLESDHTLHLDAPVSAPVRGDRQALLRVVTNLVDNAVRHSAAGTPIEVGAVIEGSRAVVRVRDRGTGGSSGNRPARAGLGLRIVRALVQAHDGDLAVHPTPDGGTLVEVAIPVASVDEATAPADGAQGEPGSRQR